ncbi:MAG: PQQ-binding-like beta-propeller repeat protein [Acidobacteriota bacterium]
MSPRPRCRPLLDGWIAAPRAAFARLAPLLTALAVAVPLATAGPLLAADPTADVERERWTQWGGPDQSFRASSADLLTSWPESGPPELWSRDLGEGYSGIVAADGRLYTLYRGAPPKAANGEETADGEFEVVVALDAADGALLWHHAYRSDPREEHVSQFGRGPRATPVLAEGRLVTIGINGLLHAFNAASGELLWSHDLWTDFGGNFLNHGYSSSPIHHDGKIITMVGGDGSGLVAFDLKTGKLAWKSLDLDNSYSAPRLLTIDGEEQIVAFMAREMVGVDPSDGSLLWSFPIENQWLQNINLPVLVDGEYLFVSSLQAGSHGLRFARDEAGEVTFEKIWSTRKIQFYHVTSVLDGHHVYGTTGGGTGPAFFAAIDVKTGEIAWRKRGFAKSNVLWADGHLYVLDEDGKLFLTKATPDDLEVVSEAQVLERVAWTVPTLVDQTLFLRDQQRIVALDLAADGQSAPANSPHGATSR